LHEWSYLTYERPKTVLNNNKLEKDRKEPLTNLVTWVYEEGSFVPSCKITERGVYSIINDYLCESVVKNQINKSNGNFTHSMYEQS